MAWTTETTPEEFLLVDSFAEDFFSTIGPLKSKENALIHIRIDWPASPTGGLQVNVYKSNDGVTFSSFAEPRRLPVSSLAVNDIYVEVAGTPFFRVGVRADGADVMDSVQFSYSRDGGLVNP